MAQLLHQHFFSFIGEPSFHQEIQYLVEFLFSFRLFPEVVFLCQKVSLDGLDVVVAFSPVLLVLASGRVGVLNFRNSLFALADLFSSSALVAALSSFRSILSRLRFTIQPNATIKNVSRIPISHHVPASNSIIRTPKLKIVSVTGFYNQ